MSTRILGLAALSVTLVINFELAAGELQPLGAPAPSIPTLEETNASIEAAADLLVQTADPRLPITALPVTITQPGSYVLTQTLTGVSGESGITIACDQVTVDLNGFGLIGVPGSVTGVTVSGQAQGVTIINGSIADWGNEGIRLWYEGPFGPTARVEGGHLRGVHLSGNGGSGAFVGSGWVVVDCTSHDNGYSGFVGMFNNVFVRCASAGNGTAGFALSNRAGVISQCTVSGNGEIGITLGDSAVITQSTVSGNGLDGIRALNGDLVVRQCLVAANDGVGIHAASGSLIEACTVEENYGGGIRIQARCRVVDNLVTRNALVIDGEDAGVIVVGDDNRIDGNHFEGNLVAIRADGPSSLENVIVRNTISDSVSDEIMFNPAVNLVAPLRTSFIGAGPWDNLTP